MGGGIECVSSMYVGTRHGNVRPGSVDLSSRCEFATFSKELQKPVAASRSRDGSARLQGGVLVASGRSAEFPDQDIAGWGFSLRHWGGVREGDLGHEVDKSVVSLRERARE